MTIKAIVASPRYNVDMLPSGKSVHQVVYGVDVRGQIVSPVKGRSASTHWLKVAPLTDAAPNFANKN